MLRHVYLCGLSEAQRSGYAQGNELSLAERVGNLTLRLDALRRRLVGVEPKQLTDLIEIASYVFAADRTTRRGTEILKNCGEDWRRNFLMVIAVRKPAFWIRADVKSALTEALGFASEDNWAAVQSFRKSGCRQRLVRGAALDPGPLASAVGTWSAASGLSAAPPRADRRRAAGWCS